MAYKSLCFKDGNKMLSISETLTTNKVNITAEEFEFENPYSPYLSFDLDYDDICELIEWLQKRKTFLEENING